MAVYALEERPGLVLVRDKRLLEFTRRHLEEAERLGLVDIVRQLGRPRHDIPTENT